MNAIPNPPAYRNAPIKVWMGLVLIACFSGMIRNASAYETYTSGCIECHGDFDGPISPKGTAFPSNSKHIMHNGNSNMDTSCSYCHVTNGDDPNIGSSRNGGPGCTGCHVAEGLRAHHALNGVVDSNGDACADCHENDDTPAEEIVNPPYYGTAGTRANHPSNDALVSNTNENWSVGDFIGLDNDGDNLYDLADYSCGPLALLEIVPEGNDLVIRWETAGGRNEAVQSVTVLTNLFIDVDAPVSIPGVGLVTQEVVHAGAAAEPVQFYRIRSEP